MFAIRCWPGHTVIGLGVIWIYIHNFRRFELVRQLQRRVRTFCPHIRRALAYLQMPQTPQADAATICEELFAVTGLRAEVVDGSWNLPSWNGLLNGESPVIKPPRPLLCFRPESKHDVLHACAVAATHGLKVSPRGAPEAIRVLPQRPVGCRLDDCMGLSENVDISAKSARVIGFARGGVGYPRGRRGRSSLLRPSPNPPPLPCSPQSPTSPLPHFVGSGHHYGGCSLVSGCLLLDLSALNSVTVSRQQRGSGLGSVARTRGSPVCKCAWLSLTRVLWSPWQSF